MAIWRIILYPFGMAFLGLLIINLAGIAVFGPDARAWADWQNHLVSALGATGGTAGFVGGVYGAMKSSARLVP